jgi:hypothetical protein
MIKQITNFKQGMNPNLYGEGISRIEHFDLTTEQARPYRALAVSTVEDGSGSVTSNLVKIARCSNASTTTNILYALGEYDTSDPKVNPTIFRWETNKWVAFKNSGSAHTKAEVLHEYKGSLYGLLHAVTTGVGYIWKSTPGATSGATSFTYNHFALSFTNYCNPITHSKDALMYIGVDNLVYKFDGTTATLMFTHPDAGFIITSLSEFNDNIVICGYSPTVGSGAGVCIEWDRTATATNANAIVQKYETYREVPYFNFTLGGTNFSITLQQSTTNPVATQTMFRMNIKYIYGGKLKLLKQFVFTTCYFKINNASVGYYIENNVAYFPAQVKFVGDSAVHFVIFRLNELGELSIAQNLAINDAGDANQIPSSILIDGESFWIACNTVGSWNTSSSYPSTSAQSCIIETTKTTSQDMTKNLDFVRATVRWEAMPSGGQVLLKTRGDEETSWTTLATFNTANSMKGVINKGGCTTQPSIAKERQMRIESTGGVAITGYQVEYDSVDNQA